MLYINRVDTFKGELNLSGFLRYAKMADWKVDVRRRLSGGRYDGRIIDCCNLPKAKIPSFTDGIPTVYLDSQPLALPGRIAFVSHDTRATVEVAVKELINGRCGHYAYVGWNRPMRPWAVQRREEVLETFVRLLPEQKCAVYNGSYGTDESILFVRDLVGFLGKLPKPATVLTANDEVAKCVLKAACAARLDIPREISVLGIDNHPGICDSTQPKLTSIQIDWERAGYLAGESLMALLSGVMAPNANRKFGPLAVIRRDSMRREERKTLHLDEVVSLIRRECTAKLTVDDVALKMGCSRRLAEMRFREAIGYGINEAIVTERFNAVVAMLLSGRRSLSAVAEMCGFASEDSLRVLFRRRYGVSPSQYRLHVSR